MSEQEIEKLPKCHFCKQPVAEGSRTRGPPKKRQYLCDDCRHILRAIIHDCAYSVFADIASIMGSSDETWVEMMEPYDYEHSQQ